jgi:hypothetical protein
MIRQFALAWISGWAALAAESTDLLRFNNGDQLHGTFAGIKEGPWAVWQREDVKERVDFKTDQVRHIVLRGGQPAKPLVSLSHVALINGDRVPGLITSMDESTVTLETAYAGALRIPRDHIAMLAPSPLGGRLRYQGPFVADEWKMAHASFPEGMPAVAPDKEPASAGKDKVDDPPGRWQFSGSAWYWSNKQYGTSLSRENAMPDRSILKFDLAWKNRLSLAVAFHADFAKAKLPDAPDQERPVGRAFGFVPGDSSILPLLFGNSYVLQIFSTHMRLYRTTVTEAGEPSVVGMSVNGNNGIRLGESGKATVEIRSNRLTGEISLFVNDEFVVQWNASGSGPQDMELLPSKANGFGFVVQTEDSSVKLSDLLVAEWNGMPDSARSLQVDAQDIVLLANGTDRFAGKVVSLVDGKITFEGKYGRFQFHLDDVAEIRFARNGLAKETDLPGDHVILRLSPLGQISARILDGDSSALRVQSPIFGEMSFNLESAVMLDFQPSSNFIDDWDVEF